MKLLLAVFFLFLVGIAGWQQPFREHYDRLSGQPMPGPEEARPAPRQPAYQAPRWATPVPRDRSWIFEPTALDPKSNCK